ncbi:MAG: type II toxin-antitoxin system VapC family toxin [Jiangellaceae bacterium]|nr:type II toxin-antitoxin system VapC family toxin [Jiangellaceae bacterium]
MIVVDASVLTHVLISPPARARHALAVLASDPAWAAPEHWQVEVFSALRRLEVERKITSDQAARAVGQLRRLNVDSVSVAELNTRMWQLRRRFTGYDAAYVALAEVRGLTFVTSDDQLARSAAPYCRIELVT